MTVECSLWLAILSAEFILFGMLVRKHVYSVLPVFTLSGVIVSVLGLACAICGTVWPLCCGSLFLVGILVHALFWLCITFEIGRNLLYWNRASAPLLPLCFLLFTGIAALLLLLERWTAPESFTPQQRLSVYALQSAGVAQMAAFLTLAWWALLRQFAWPRTEFRLATGIGLQSFVCLVAGILLTYRCVHWNCALLLAPEAAYLLVLIRWMISFQRESRSAAPCKSLSCGTLAERLGRAEKFGS